MNKFLILILKLISIISKYEEKMFAYYCDDLRNSTNSIVCK